MDVSYLKYAHKTMPCVKGCLKSWTVCYTLAPLNPTSSNGTLVRLKIRHHEWERGGPKMDCLILKQDESGKHNPFWRRKWTHHDSSSYFPPNSPLKLRLFRRGPFTFRHGKHTPNLKGWHFCCAHRRPWKFTNQAGQLLLNPTGRYNPSLKLDFSSRNIVIYLYNICQGMLNWDKGFSLYLSWSLGKSGRNVVWICCQGLMMGRQYAWHDVMIETCYDLWLV